MPSVIFEPFADKRLLKIIKPNLVPRSPSDEALVYDSTMIVSLAAIPTRSTAFSTVLRDA